MTRARIPILRSVAELAPRYDAWIVDIWGVMHNGARAYAAAGDACRRFRDQGGLVLLLSNAPRPFAAVVAHMDELGVDRQAYDAGVTSGDATREMLAEWQGRSVLHIGPQRDKGLFAGLDMRLSDPEEADMVLCSGFYDDTKETPSDYAGLLEALAARRVPMICANPDVVVGRGNKLVYCAGALAEAFQAKDGEVIYAGKPHAPIYHRALRELAGIKGQPLARERVLCIGDGIDTDLLGAHGAGVDSLFVASAVSAPHGIDDALVQELFATRPFAPIASMHALAW